MDAARAAHRRDVLLALAPWLGGTYATLSLTSALALGLFALSYDLVLGVTGLVSVSHATLFGVGAYGMAIGMTKPDRLGRGRRARRRHLRAGSTA